MGPHRALLLLLLVPLLPLRSQVLSPVTVPLRLHPNATEDAVSYILSIEGRPYTIRLQPHVFLSEDFKIYVSNEVGSARSDSIRFKVVLGCFGDFVL